MKKKRVFGKEIFHRSYPVFKIGAIQANEDRQNTLERKVYSNRDGRYEAPETRKLKKVRS